MARTAANLPCQRRRNPAPLARQVGRSPCHRRRSGLMSSSTELAHSVVDELLAHGVREVVLAPGSRSGPMALALFDADKAGALRLHVRVDERTAGFLALGMAKASRRTVPVVTTSGTAVANLHPAVLEAKHSRVRLLVISADRPEELRGTGANQTTNQERIFGEIPYAGLAPGRSRVLKSRGCWKRPPQALP